MYEHRGEPLLSRAKFKARVRRHFAISVSLSSLALFAGMTGYHLLESMTWLDSFLNASMILGGMGPVGDLKTSGGKLFAGLYALFSGVFFLAMFSIMFAPIFHRALHKFHLDIENGDGPAAKK